VVRVGAHVEGLLAGAQPGKAADQPKRLRQMCVGHATAASMRVVLTFRSSGVQPRAYNRAELVDILGLVAEPKPESQDSRPLLLSIVESLLNEVGGTVPGSD
jgi:hypothetical protein